MEQICTGLLNDQNKQTVVPFLVLSANTTEAEKITSQENSYDIFAELNSSFKNTPNDTFEND